MYSGLTREVLQTARQMLGPDAFSDDVIKVIERNAGVEVID